MIRIALATAALSLLACTSDPPPKKTRSVADRRDDRVADAVDEDAPASAPASAPATAPRTQPASDPREALQRKLYDRVLCRVEGRVDDLEGLKAEIAAATGAEVLEIKRGALGMLSVRFKPRDPPRDRAAQDALVEKLRTMGTFRAVEAEKLMIAK